MSLVLVDANVILRIIVGPRSASDDALITLADTLLDEAAAGLHELTVNDAVIAELVFVLTSPRTYALDRVQAGTAIRTVLEDDRLRIPGKDAVLAAFDRWMSTSSLSFVDALVIERAREAGALVASFDAAVSRNALGGVWAPSSG